jgi:ATP/ADP translocase
MSLRTYLILPICIILIGIVYWFFSYEPAGAVMLIVFGGAMAVMGFILLPTLDNIGPTAPVDPDFEDPGR